MSLYISRLQEYHLYRIIVVHNQFNRKIIWYRLLLVEYTNNVKVIRIFSLVIGIEFQYIYNLFKEFIDLDKLKYKIKSKK